MSDSETQSSSQPRYTDGEFLRQRYVEEKKSTIDIADELDCAPNTVRKYLRENGVEIRSLSESVTLAYGNHPNGVALSMQSKGYMRWNYAERGGERGSVFVHRLLAVAEYGFDAVCDSAVHHKNDIPWDNRPSNIELMDHGEHSKLHHLKVTGDERRKVADLYEYTDRSSYDISQDFDVCAATVRAIHEEYHGEE